VLLPPLPRCRCRVSSPIPNDRLRFVEQKAQCSKFQPSQKKMRYNPVTCADAAAYREQGAHSLIRQQVPHSPLLLPFLRLLLNPRPQLGLLVSPSRAVLEEVLFFFFCLIILAFSLCKTMAAHYFIRFLSAVPEGSVAATLPPLSFAPVNIRKKTRKKIKIKISAPKEKDPSSYRSELFRAGWRPTREVVVVADERS